MERPENVHNRIGPPPDPPEGWARIRVSNPIVEHRNDNINDKAPNIIRGREPRLSWRFSVQNSALEGFHQTAYEIKIAGWGQPHDRFHVESSKSVLVPWPGRPLPSRASCQVKVRAFGQDKYGRKLETLWSEWTYINAAPRPDDLVAQFIGSSNPQSDGPLRPIRFRRAFSVPQFDGYVDSAKLYITAYGVYRAWINGKRVGDDEMAPGWTSYSHRHYYQGYDVRKLLRPEGNVIAVEVAEGWYAGRLGWANQRHIYGKELGLFAQLEVLVTESLDPITVLSDDTWTCGYGSLLGSQIYDGEIFDHNLETPGWDEDFAFRDSRWIPTKILPMTEAEMFPSDAPPVRVIEDVKPKRIFHSASGRTIVDFGQNLVGKLFAKRIHKPNNHRIVFRHAEVMANGEIGARPLRSAMATDVIISSGRPIHNWSPRHTFHGFRYVEVEGWSPTDELDPLTVDSIEAKVMHTDMKRTGWFSCSDDHVNQLHENTVWSMRGNFLSIPTDCPQRDERLGWTGDIQVFGPSANFLFDTNAMLGHWLEDVSAEQADFDGIPPFVVPNILASDEGDNSWGNFPQAVWDDVVVLLPWALYRASGDEEILLYRYAGMQDWLEKGIKRGPDGLWDPSFHQLGDWLDPSAPPDRPGQAKTDGTFVADAYLLHVLQVMIKISEVLGYSAETAKYTLEYKGLKRAFSRKYITLEGLLAADTQTGLALAIRFDLFKDSKQARVAADRLERAVRLADFKVATGFAGTPIITHALSSVGLQNLAYRMLLEEGCPSWLYPVTMGATTIWERWDSMLPDGSINPGEMTSFNHYALGSIVNWLHEVVGGISPLEAGWKKSLIRPVPGGSLTWAKVKHDTPYGRLSCKWSLKNDEFRMSLTVPPNTSARVVMPDKQGSEILGQAEESLEVGSGKYEYSCKFVREKFKPTPIPIPFFSPVREETWF